MENIIKLLNDIDKKAQELDKQAIRTKETMESDIANEIKAIDQKYMDNAQNTVDKEVANIRNQVQEEWEKEEANRNTIIRNLTKDFYKNCDKWVDQIFEEVLN